MDLDTATESQPGATSSTGSRYGVAVSHSHGQTVLHPARRQWLEVAAQANRDGFDQLMDLTAVDYLNFQAPRVLPDSVVAERFEVVVNLLSHSRYERLRLRVQVPVDDPTLPTLFDIWCGVENLEREVHDLFGLVFDDHPDLSRILMPEDWVGHPLRKDYDAGWIPVRFKSVGDGAR